MIRDNYISLLGLLLHRFVSPVPGTHDGKLSLELPRHLTVARKSTGNSGLAYAFRVRMPCRHGEDLYGRVAELAGELADTARRT